MKHYYTLLLLTITSCSTIGEAPILNYYTSRASGEMVCSLKISTARTVRTLQHSYNEKYHTPLWKNIYRKHENDTIKDLWAPKDFSNKAELISYESLKKLWLQKQPTVNRKKVHYFSDIIYSHDKNYAAFSHMSGTTSFGVGVLEDEVIVMKNENNEWIIDDVVQNDPHINP